jgi:hypothetical protein
VAAPSGGSAWLERLRVDRERPGSIAERNVGEAAGGRSLRVLTGRLLSTEGMRRRGQIRTLGIAQTQRCGSAQPRHPRHPRDDRIPGERSSRRAPSWRCLWRPGDDAPRRRRTSASPRTRSPARPRDDSMPLTTSEPLRDEGAHPGSARAFPRKRSRSPRPQRGRATAQVNPTLHPGRVTFIELARSRRERSGLHRAHARAARVRAAPPGLTVGPPRTHRVRGRIRASPEADR